MLNTTAKLHQTVMGEPGAAGCGARCVGEKLLPPRDPKFCSRTAQLGAGSEQPPPARNAAGPCCLQPQPREPAAGPCRSAPQGKRHSRAPRGARGTRRSRPEMEISHAAAHSQQRPRALRRLPAQSIHALPSEGQGTSPGLRDGICSASDVPGQPSGGHGDLGAAWGSQDRNPAQPQLSPASACRRMQ